MEERLDSQDVAKGLMIFFAVMMHVVRADEVPVWRVAISSFHVPLFFLVSGLVVGRATKGWLPYIRKNALVLLVPYLAWTLIYTPFRLENLPWVLYGNWMSLQRIGANVLLWFLPALFCARLLFEAVMRLLERTSLPRLPGVFLAAAGSFAVGMFLPIPSMGYPLGLGAAIVALGFLLLGSVIGDSLKALGRQHLGLQTAALVLTVAMFAYGAFLRPGEHVLVGFAEFKFGSRFWFFWNALSGCAAVLCVSALVAAIPKRGWPFGSVRRFSVWLGRNAIGVLILHMPIMRLLVTPCSRACGLDCRGWYVALVNAVVTVAVCCPLICVARKFLPKLSGLFGLREERP